MQSVRLFSPGVFLQDRYAAYRKLRAEHPVFYDSDADTWFLTKYEDVFQAARDFKTFSSEVVELTAALYQFVSGESGGSAAPVSLIQSDPPRHTLLRGLVNHALTPRKVEELKPRIREMVDGLLDAITESPVDIVETLCIPLPVFVLFHLLGLPTEDHKRIKRWSNAVILGGPGQRDPEQQRGYIAELMEYIARLAEARRADPGNDLISDLVQAKLDGEPLADWELRSLVFFVLVAGHETTTNLMGNLLDILADRPDLWQQLREDRSLVLMVVEEALRYHSSVQMLFRKTTRDVEVSGVTIPKGARVGLVWAAANHDPGEFDDPDSFRVDRQHDELKKHLAFGTGIHYCLGAPLARAELSIAMDAMLDRYTAIEHAEERGERLRTPIVLGFEHLPLYLRT